MKSTSRYSILFATCAIMLCASGCTTTVNTAERQQPIGERQMVADKRVITDESLNRRVNIVGINQDVVGGLLRVQVEVQNKSDSPHSFRYHFEWFDANGMLVSSPASWIDRQILGRDTLMLMGIAPTEGAKDFKIKLMTKPN